MIDLTEKQAPVFIVGCDRSGTTLLRLMLIQSAELHIPAESRFFGRLMKNVNLYDDFSLPHQRYFLIRDLQTNKATQNTFTFPIFELTVAEAESALQDEAVTSYPSAVNSLYVASAKKKNKHRWGDKTPRYVQEIELLADAFPNAKFIHMIRDARDAIASIHKVGWIGDIPSISRYWKTQVETGRLAGEKLGPKRYQEVMFETLVAYPEETLKHICSWLHLDYSPQMLNFYQSSNLNIPPEHKHLFTSTQRPVDVSRIGRWKNYFTKQDVADIERITAPLLTDLGYEKSNIKPSILIVSKRTTKTLIKSIIGYAKKELRSISC